MHVDKVHNSNATRLQNILSSFDCVQHVNRPTHRDGHILDLLITAADTVVSGLTVGYRVSDHCLITFTVLTVRPAAVFNRITWRRWKQMDEEQFTLDLEQSQLCGDIDALQYIYWSVDDLVRLYTDTLTDLIDRHCPVSSVRKKIVKL